MPGLERAHESNDHAAGLLRHGSNPVRVDAIGDGVGTLRARHLLHPGAHRVRHADNRTRRTRLLHERGARSGLVIQATMTTLLLDEGRVHLEDPAHTTALREGRERRGEQRVALPHEVRGALRDALRDRARGLGLGALAVARAVHIERVLDGRHVGQVGGDTVPHAHGVDLHVVAAAHELAHDVLDVDGGSLGSENRDAGVGADVDDTHQRVSSSLSRRARADA